MYVLVRRNEIIDAFEESLVQESDLRTRYPDCEVLQTDLTLPTQVFRAVTRMYNGRVTRKPTVVLTPDKPSIKPDGEDEVSIKIEIFDTQPDEVINEITLDVDGVKTNVPIVNNEGMFKFATTQPDIIIISVDDPDVCTSKVGITAYG